jgi:hypothetical protein
MWLSKLESGNRLELPRALAYETDWLSADAVTPIEAVMFPIEELNGVQLLPAQRKQPDSKEEFERDFDMLIYQVATSVRMSEQEARQSRRLLSNRWPVNVEVRKQSFRITVPKEARKLSLLPDYPGIVVIFASAEDNRVELWDSALWLQNLQASKSLFRERIDEYLAELAKKPQVKKKASRRSK